MSKVGIQSNRGDGYQTLVAIEWALTVLSDPDYPWLEVEEAACRAGTKPFNLRVSPSHDV